MNRDELLRFDGVPRSELERRIRALVPVLDAARELAAADDDAVIVDAAAMAAAEERYERAWDALRAVLSDIC